MLLKVQSGWLLVSTKAFLVWKAQGWCAGPVELSMHRTALAIWGSDALMKPTRALNITKRPE